MPNRIIREGILSSDRVDLLDYPAEVFYRRLMSKVDDHGLFDARPSILRTSLYPLRVDRVREADITRWIAACEKAGVIALYQHDGKPYLQMMDTRWQARSEAKYPLPPVITGDDPQAPANNCAQVQTVAQVDVFVVGDEDVVDKDKAQAPAARKRAASFDAKAIELPDWLDAELWGRWVDDRKERRKPITKGGAKEQLSKLNEYRLTGRSPKEVIEHSIASGYQGLFPPSRSLPSVQSQCAPAIVVSPAVAETRRMLAEREERWQNIQRERAERKAREAQEKTA